MVTIWPVMQFTVYGCILGISWLGAHMIVASQMTTGELMSLLTYCMTILMNLMMLAMIFVMMTMSAASAKRIAEVLEEKADITNPEQPDYDVTDGSIRFDHVTFRYNKQSEKPVLDDLNFEIKAGETIGILGGTGSSKTSLVNLISRLYDVNEGTVYVGGKDVRNYDLETLRNEVSVVLQKTCCSPVRSWRTSAGATRTLPKRSASVPVVWHAPMNLLKRCLENTILILSRAEAMYPADRSRDCV